jgi:hypothetical protein
VEQHCKKYHTGEEEKIYEGKGLVDNVRAFNA